MLYRDQREKIFGQICKIIEDKDGKEVVLIDNIIFKGKRKINWKKVMLNMDGNDMIRGLHCQCMMS